MQRRLTLMLSLAAVTLLAWQLFAEKLSFNPAIKLSAAVSAQQTLDNLNLSQGFSISIHASELPGVRALISTRSGDLIISQPRSGTVSLIYHDANNDGTADGKAVLVKGLNRPHGLALHKGWLYIAETDAVLRIRFDAERGITLGQAEYIIQQRFPGDGNHWTRSIKISPNNKLLLSIGSSCNVCIEHSEKRASIWQYDLDGRNETLYASGLRNTVGFDWKADTLDLYGVDNGRDFLGDDEPPEELNRIRPQQHYGWPYQHGDGQADPSYASQKPAALITQAPSHLLPAHSAPLSLLFIKHNPVLKGRALVTLHGSWNRSKKSGYKVVMLSFLADQSIQQTDFISGFEKDNRVFGRPVDLTEDRHGNIYLSDDFNGRVYRIATRLPEQ